MHKPKENSRSSNVISIPGAGHDSLEDALNQFLMWEMRSRDCIEVKRCYIDVAKDLESGVLLSQIVYWHLPDSLGKQKLTVYRDGYWWLAKGRSNWWAECRLTPKQFDRAIRQLEQQQLVCTQVYKWQGQNTKHIRIDWTGLLQALSMLDTSPDSVVGFRRREPVKSASRASCQETKQKTIEFPFRESDELPISPTSRLPNRESDELPNRQFSGLPNSQSLNSLIGNSQIAKKGSSELTNREFHLYTEITSEITLKDYSSPLTPQGGSKRSGEELFRQQPVAVRIKPRPLASLSEQPELPGKESTNFGSDEHFPNETRQSKIASVQTNPLATDLAPFSQPCLSELQASSVPVKVITKAAATTTQKKTDTAAGDQLDDKLSQLLERYNRGEIGKLPEAELKMLAPAVIGDTVKLYRNSGIVLSSTPNDVDRHLLQFIALRDKKDFVYGIRLIAAMERTPERWGELVELVSAWLLGDVNAIPTAAKHIALATQLEFNKQSTYDAIKDL